MMSEKEQHIDYTTEIDIQCIISMLMQSITVVLFFFAAVICPHEVTKSSYYEPKRCGKPLARESSSRRGLINRDRGHKIMGGENVQWGAMPWAVAIYENREYACSGTLISKKHVITAAHCFAKVPHITTNCRYSINKILQVFTVRYGSNCLNVFASPECNRTYPMKKTTIVRVVLQPFFEVRCRNLDIALLELRDEIDDSANYICLPHRLISDRLISMVAFGWGSNPLIGARVMNVLQTISINRLMPYRLCRLKWTHIYQGQICTSEINTRGACTGDSGGGLVGQTEEGQWILYGVISFGSDCKSLLKDASPRAQVYTSVSYFAASIDVFTETLFPWIAVD